MLFIILPVQGTDADLQPLCQASSQHQHPGQERRLHQHPRQRRGPIRRGRGRSSNGSLSMSIYVYLCLCMSIYLPLLNASTYMAISFDSQMVDYVYPFAFPPFLCLYI